jgi:site-specific recombinase XerD
MQNQTRAATLHKGEFQRLIKITQATAKLPERDVLVLMLGHKAGLRITEISRITIADVMFPSGKLREEVSLRAAVTKGCRPRSAFFVQKKLVAAMEAYLQYRIDKGIGTELGAVKYRGLLPHQPVIYSARGAPMQQNTKRRLLDSGEVKHFKACDSLQSHVTKLYKLAGITGGSSHSGRRTFAGKVLAATGDFDKVALLLGHTNIDVSQRYIDVREDTLRTMFAEAI